MRDNEKDNFDKNQDKSEGIFERYFFKRVNQKFLIFSIQIHIEQGVYRRELLSQLKKSAQQFPPINP